MDDGFKILERLIYATNIRNKVIASNIANSDTPYYRAKDVSFNVLVGEASKDLKKTDSKHLPAKISTYGNSEIIIQETQSWGDGNNVELDMELAKMNENALMYEAGIRLLSSKMRMFRNALKGR